MPRVIAFDPARRRVEPAPVETGVSATLLLFTGVRYERTAVADKNPVAPQPRKHGKRIAR